MHTLITSVECVGVWVRVCVSSLYLNSQKSFIIWEDSVCVDMLLKPAEEERNRESRGKNNTKEKERWRKWSEKRRERRRGESF